MNLRCSCWAGYAGFCQLLAVYQNIALSEADRFCAGSYATPAADSAAARLKHKETLLMALEATHEGMPFSVIVNTVYPPHDCGIANLMPSGSLRNMLKASSSSNHIVLWYSLMAVPLGIATVASMSKYKTSSSKQRFLQCKNAGAGKRINLR